MQKQQGTGENPRNRRQYDFFAGIFGMFLFLMLAVFTTAASAGQTTLHWSQPTTNEDGTPITDLSGYKIYYGTATKNYSRTIAVGNVTTHTVANLVDGTTYYFAVTAFNSFSKESRFSTEITRKIPLPVQQYSLTVIKEGRGTGTIASSPAGVNCGSDCSEAYNAGTSVTLTASPGNGSTFAGWTGACTGNYTCSITLDVARTVTATFQPKTYVITAAATAGGSISPLGQVVVNHGGTTSYAISPTKGYIVADVSVDGKSVGAVNSYTFSNITANHTIDVSFESDRKSLIIIDNGEPGTFSTGVWAKSGGTLPYGADSLWARAGATYTWLLNLPEPGVYEISMWWSGLPSRATSIPVTITHQNGQETLKINQQQNAGMWNTLGRYSFNGEGRVGITAAYGSAVSTCADAVRAEYISGYMPEIIIDNTDANTSRTGAWGISGATKPYGKDSVWSRDGATFSWNFKPAHTGAYDVSMWWTAWPSRSAAVPVDIQYEGGKDRIYINQQTDGGIWNTLGTYYFAAGATYKVTIISQPNPTSTCADAVKFDYVQ